MSEESLDVPPEQGAKPHDVAPAHVNVVEVAQPRWLFGVFRLAIPDPQDPSATITTLDPAEKTRRPGCITFAKRSWKMAGVPASFDMDDVDVVLADPMPQLAVRHVRLLEFDAFTARYVRVEAPVGPQATVTIAWRDDVHPAVDENGDVVVDAAPALVDDSQRPEFAIAGNGLPLTVKCTGLPGLRTVQGPAPTVPHPIKGGLQDIVQGTALYAARLPNEIWLELGHFNAGGDKIGHDVALVTIAPVLFPSALEKPRRVFLMFNEDKSEQVDEHTSETTPGNYGFASDMCVAAAGAGVATVGIVSGEGSSLWLRDYFLLGYLRKPGERTEVAVHTRRVLEDPFARPVDLLDIALYMDLHFDLANGGGAGTFDSGGNVMASPPVTATTQARDDGYGPPLPLQRAARFGKLVFGDRGSGDRRPHATVRKWLEAQLMQPLLPVDTSWLAVGHVDEIVSFARAKDGKATMFIAWPDDAIRILVATLDVLDSYRGTFAADFAPELLHVRPPRSRATAQHPAPYFPSLSLEAMLSAFSIGNDPARPLRRDACVSQQRLDGILARLEHGLATNASGIAVVKLPVLFDPNAVLTRATMPNAVNMVPLGTHLILPKPWGPRVHREVAGRVLVELGLDDKGLGRFETETLWLDPNEQLIDIARRLGARRQRDVTEAAPLTSAWSEEGQRKTEKAKLPHGWRRHEFHVGNVDVFEAYLCKLLEPRGFTVSFVDDFERYHLLGGEVHCATNVLHDDHEGVDPWWVGYDQHVTNLRRVYP
jgi:hypothetical protein